VTILSLHHANLTFPPELEAETVRFYAETLGLEPLPKPQGRRSQGAWLRVGAAEIHLSPDAPGRAEQLAADRHLCLVVSDLDAAEARLRAAGALIEPDPRPPVGYRRLFTRDPAGNRLELSEPPR
ncbi:VOC family protein, partial [Inquilinus limosus]|uniref:VOC family protein n=1 Tax=Inquilinus limosus TaxID=171674 RepID=UPI001376AD98